VKPKQHLADYEFDTRIKKRGALQQGLFHRSNVRLLSVSEEQIDSVLAALREDPDLEFAERDPLAQACVIVNDPFVLSGAEWHLEKIEASRAWDITNGASNVTVAVLDSGVNFLHPDLQGRILPGYDFVSNNSHPMDDFGHGTAVAGTIVAGGNNGLGVAGTAFGCTVLPVKVMDQYGSASHSTIALGIEYAVQHGARVVNLSLGAIRPLSPCRVLSIMPGATTS
jgi:thermitase